MQRLWGSCADGCEWRRFGFALAGQSHRGCVRCGRLERWTVRQWRTVPLDSSLEVVEFLEDAAGSIADERLRINRRPRTGVLPIVDHERLEEWASVVERLQGVYSGVVEFWEAIGRPEPVSA